MTDAELIEAVLQLQQVAGRIKGFIPVNGAPSNMLGSVGSVAFDLDARVWYGPKSEAGWPAGIPVTSGPVGPSGTITGVSIETGAAGSSASIVLGGTPSARTLAFTLPRGDTGASGTITSATASTGAPGSDVAITLGGSASARTLAFAIPRGDTGASGTITSATASTGAPGSDVAITLGGTASARTLAFAIPRGDVGATPSIAAGTVTTGAPGSDAAVSITGSTAAPVLNFTIPRGDKGDKGDTGAVPNVSAEIALIAHGGTATVTRSGPDTAPVFTFNIPAPLDGEDGREVEFNVAAGYIQQRFVGETTWNNLVALADLKGEKGDRGEAFAVGATGPDLAARDAYDAEAGGFSFVDTSTGLISFRQGATAGVWSDGIPFAQAQSDVLDALAALNATAGVLVQTGSATFTKRGIGVGTGASIPDRDAGDTRWRLASAAVPIGEVSGLSAALGEKADAGAVLAALGGKLDADATLSAIAALTTSADKLLYATGADTFALADFSAAARTLLGQTTQAGMRTAGLGLSANGSSLVSATDYAAMRNLLGLVIGTHVQAYDDDLAAIAALTTTPYGRGLLALADAAALKTAAGVPVKAAGADLRVMTDDAKFLTAKSVADAAALVALTDSATIAVDLSAGANFILTLGGNRTLGAPTNAKPGASGTILIKQDATGSRTLSYASGWLPFGSTPALTTTASAVDLLTYIVETSGKVRFSLSKGGAA